MFLLKTHDIAIWFPVLKLQLRTIPEIMGLFICAAPYRVCSSLPLNGRPSAAWGINECWLEDDGKLQSKLFSICVSYIYFYSIWTYDDQRWMMWIGLDLVHSHGCHISSLQQYVLSWWIVCCIGEYRAWLEDDGNLLSIDMSSISCLGRVWVLGL